MFWVAGGAVERLGFGYQDAENRLEENRIELERDVDERVSAILEVLSVLRIEVYSRKPYQEGYLGSHRALVTNATPDLLWEWCRFVEPRRVALSRG